YLASQSPRFSVLTGNAGIFQHALATGAKGGILAVSLFATALSLDVLDSMRSGNASAAVAAQERLTPLNAKIVAELGVSGIKAAMDRVGRGVCGGPVRSPLLPLDAAQSRQVAELPQRAHSAHLTRLGAFARPAGGAGAAAAQRHCRSLLEALGFVVREQEFEYSVFGGAWAMPVLGVAAPLLGTAAVLARRTHPWL